MFQCCQALFPFFFLLVSQTFCRDVREKPFMLHYEVCCSLISGCFFFNACQVLLSNVVFVSCCTCLVKVTKTNLSEGHQPVSRLTFESCASS